MLDDTWVADGLVPLFGLNVSELQDDSIHPAGVMLSRIGKSMM